MTPIKLLKGIRVLDLTNVLAGPFCCHQLAHHGAEVIKVEIPARGDLARQLGADLHLNKQFMGASFLAQNSGKKSITINLKKPEGNKIFLKLVKTADVLVENYRPGVSKKLGIDYARLKKIKKELIYCAISGFGQNSPLKNIPAYDQIIQGLAGVMSITGDQNSAPLRVGYPIADTIGGMTAAFAISSALSCKKRGCFIDISMLEAVLSTMGWVASNHLITGKKPMPIGNDNFTASPSGTFQTKKGLLNISANKQEQFESLCVVLDKECWAKDPRFAKRENRLKNRKTLSKLIHHELKNKTAKQWFPIMTKKGIPAGEILTIDEVFSSTQLVSPELIASYENIQGLDLKRGKKKNTKKVKIVRSAIKINGKQVKTKNPPPFLGKDTRAILLQLGYSTKEIKQFKSDEVL